MELKAIRENAGLRQEDVAKKLRVRVSAVSNWERGVNGWNAYSKLTSPFRTGQCCRHFLLS